MRRRDFIVGCASGLVTAKVLSAQTRSSDSSSKAAALSVLMSCRQHEANGDYDRFQKSYHSNALRCEPGTIGALVGSSNIAQACEKNAKDRKLVYHYYRQPQVLNAGGASIVVSNYEACYERGGKMLEETGKCSNIVLTGSNAGIAVEMQVPNRQPGGYGALGTAFSTPPWDNFPVRALNLAHENQNAGGGEKDALYAEVKRINAAWLSGDASAVLKNANKSGLFLIGDYSPYFITGNDEIKQHFADFYKTSRVNSIKSLDPVVQIFGDSAAVYFNFDLDYVLDGKQRRAPGRAIYTFVRGEGASRAATVAPHFQAVALRGCSPAEPAFEPPSGPISSVSTCAASHIVAPGVGDPYPSS